MPKSMTTGDKAKGFYDCGSAPRTCMELLQRIRQTAIGVAVICLGQTRLSDMRQILLVIQAC